MDKESQSPAEIPPADTDLDAQFQAHDASVARRGVEIWVGAEPTFTLHSSEAPEWLSEALGGDKYLYALRMVAALRRGNPGRLVMRSVGRQYAGEASPRWSVGLLERRDGGPLWSGPPDPLADATQTPPKSQLDALCLELHRRLDGNGWPCQRFKVATDLEHRLVFRIDPALPAIDANDEQLARPSAHSCKTPSNGLEDTLAAAGLMLLAIGGRELSAGVATPCIELPAFASVDDFLGCLAVIEAASRQVGLSGLVLQGHPPPVDERIAWTTVTPDPAVIEVNQAPQPTIALFLDAMHELYEVAALVGLSPYRLQYNGTVSDSGGGGQFTLGGRSATTSPFFARPALLPRLVRYLNNHPSLSYLFAPDYVGGASQSPRTDEKSRDAIHELTLTLAQLDRLQQPSPEFLWASLAPFLADPSGNAHRSELNIEKLWNEYLPGRGRLGLVEFRAFRMPRSAQRAAAIAAMLRAIATMLADVDPTPQLRDWGDVLHDRFALPYFLRQDLKAVFAELTAHHLGLGEQLQSVLSDNPFASCWQTQFGGYKLALESAVEFWPLVGDVASQEAGGSRLVDSSTLRMQVSLLKVDAEAPDLDGWTLQTEGYELPLRCAHDNQERIRLIGLRYRDFKPWRGLHPSIRPHGPLTLTLSHPDLDEALEVTLHNWQPAGSPYDGLPENLQIAAARREERLVRRALPRRALATTQAPPAEAVSGYTVDLRRLLVSEHPQVSLS